MPKKPTPATSEELHELARMAQDQFADMNSRFEKVEQGQARLLKGQARILEAILGVPSKSALARLASKVDDHEDRIEAVERKLKAS